MNRYTDTDVMNDERLPIVALDYLSKYTGNFEVVLAAKRVVESGQKLTPPQVRCVLNCMLADTNVVNMPVPERRPYDASEILAAGEGHEFAISRSREGVNVTIREPARMRPVRIGLKSRWKFDFGTSMHKQARAIHLLAHEMHDRRYGEAPVTYYPYVRQFQLKAYWSCGTQIALHLVKGLTLDEANELVRVGERIWCRACDRATEGKWILDAQGYRTKTEG